jgi:hypothetical protein
MFTLDGLTGTLVDATKRYAISDPDVKRIEGEALAILRAISPDGTRSTAASGDVHGDNDHGIDPDRALVAASDLFHRVTAETHRPDRFDLGDHHTGPADHSYSRKAMRLAYCLKILAEAVSGGSKNEPEDRSIAREIHPPRQSPATEAHVPYFRGEAVNVVSGSDLETAARDIANEIRELDQLGS